MQGRPHILILTAPTGGGHLSLAEALCDQFEMDFAVTILHMLPSFFGDHYRFVGCHALGAWSIAFHATTNYPGQEEGNLEFIQQYGLGWVALKLEQQSELITLIAWNGTQANTVRGKIKEYRQWNDTANTFILPLIRSLVAGNRQLQT
jgi:hypothetical protein